MNEDSANGLKPPIGALVGAAANTDWPPEKGSPAESSRLRAPPEAKSKILAATCRRHLKLITLNHRTHKRFEYRREPLKMPPHARMLLQLVLILASFSLAINCLDSPVKVQRHKQAAISRDGRAGRPEFSEATSNHSQDEPASHENDFAAILNGAMSTNSTNRASKSDRVRRTDQQEGLRGSGSSQISHSGRHSESECPSKKVIQSLLPAEYVATGGNQRQQQLRAVCDCLVESSGWTITCYNDSAKSIDTSRAMSSRLTANPQLPKQMHPAFEPQLQRQQQQQQQAAASGHPLRRVHRSPVRWMGDEDAPVTGKNVSSDEIIGTDSALSEQEGFGDDLLSTTSQPRTDQAEQRRRQEPKYSEISSRTGSLEINQQEFRNKSLNLNSNEDSLISSSSSNSFALAQPQQQDGEFNTAIGGGRVSEKLLAPSATSNNDYLVTTILFNVKYLRDTMIEIDCDQMAPHYKPAMFQGKFWIMFMQPARQSGFASLVLVGG